MECCSYLSKQLANANWGEKTIDELAKFIQENYPDLKGFNRRGLYRMTQFYETYVGSEIVSSAMTQLQSTNIKHDEIVPSAMTQLENEDIRQSILTKIS